MLAFSPEPPFRLPFLSFLQNFIAIDESTLHLISRSPDSHTPALFASSPGPNVPATPEANAEEPHGSLRLLLYNPDKPEDISLLKAGLDPLEIPAEGNPFLLIPSEISVWKLVKLVIDGGAKAWKEVRVWRVGEVPLIGV